MARNVMRVLRRGFLVAATCVIAAIGFVAWQMSRIDPFDRFELLSVVSDPTATRHAATYRYSHANSSSTVTAVWVLSGRASTKGSSEPVHGNPALIWRGSPELVQLIWQDRSQKFLAEMKGPVDIHSGVESFRDCYFADPALPNLICLQPDQIDFRVVD